MPRLNLSLPKGLTGSIVSDHESLRMDTQETRMFLGAYLPGSSIVDQPASDPDLLVKHRQSEDFRLFQSGTKAHIYEPWEDEMPLDVYHLLYSAQRAKLIEKGVFPVHSACVETSQGDSILIIGPSGAGKSTTALELVTKSGMKMVSGNKTVIEFDENSNMRPIAGTPTMTIKASDQERFDALIENALEYYGRLAFRLKQEYFAQSSASKIRAIIAVRLQDEPQFVSPPESPESAFHQLYHPFLDINCTHATVSKSEGVFITTDSRDQIERLAAKLRKALRVIPFIKMRGSASFVRTQIETLISNNYGAA